MFCQKCGKEATQNAEFCQYCGSELGSADKSDNDQIEVSSSIQSVEKEKDQLLEPQKKDKSKSFLGGVHHPWRRFFARTVDLMTIGFLIFMLFSYSLGYLFPKNIDGFTKFLETSIGPAVLLYALWLPVEALFLSLAGTTPAKWIFGIRITTATGENLSYGQALERTWLVFVQGEGFGIPLVTLFTRLFAYHRLTKTGTTLWDTSVGCVVMHKKWGVIRAIASVLVTLVVLVILSIVTQMNNSYS